MVKIIGGANDQNAEISSAYGGQNAEISSA